VASGTEEMAQLRTLRANNRWGELWQQEAACPQLSVTPLGIDLSGEGKYDLFPIR